MHVQTNTPTPGKHQGPHVYRKGQTSHPCPATHESLHDKAPACQSPRPPIGITHTV